MLVYISVLFFINLYYDFSNILPQSFKDQLIARKLLYLILDLLIIWACVRSSVKSSCVIEGNYIQYFVSATYFGQIRHVYSTVRSC